MQRIVMSQGLNKGYDLPDSSDSYERAHQISRYRTPFRQTKKGWDTVSVSGAQNSGDPESRQDLMGKGSFATFDKPGTSSSS